MMIDGHTAHGMAMLVQISKSMHQAAINQGSWEIAALLLPTEDPLSRPEFGGDAEEMIRVQSHRRSMRDLRTTVGKNSAADGEETPDVTNPKPKRKAKAKWGKKKEEGEE